MVRLNVISAGLAAAVLLGLQTASAHHASSGLYDRETTVTIRGQVESLVWRNPHVRFVVLTSRPDGTHEAWEIEAGSVNTLERIGITADRIEIGSTVEVTGAAGRNGRRIMFAGSMVTQHGERLPLQVDAKDRYTRPEADGAPQSIDSAEATDIFRVWVPTSVPNTGAGGVEFPLTEAARAARSLWNPADDPALRCIPPGMPAAMDNPYPIEFEDRGDEIILRLEEWDGLRTIHMSPEDAAESPQPTPMGYSVGRWDGSSLIVETSAIDYPYFDDLGTPQSDAIHVTERFDLNPSSRQLSWTAEIVDPENFNEPAQLEIEWQWIPGNVIKPFNCALPEND